MRDINKKKNYYKIISYYNNNFFTFDFVKKVFAFAVLLLIVSSVVPKFSSASITTTSTAGIQYATDPVAFRDALIAEIANDPDAKTSLNTFTAQADTWLSDSPKTSYIDPDTGLSVPITTFDTGGKAFTDPYIVAIRECTPDFNKIYHFSYSYFLTKDVKYKTAAINFLTAWASANTDVSTNPIEETETDLAIRGYLILRPYLTTAEKAPIDSWLSNKASILGVDVAIEVGSNFKSHRLKTVGLIGLALGNQTYIEWAEQAFKDQIRQNLNPMATPNHGNLSRVDPSIIQAETLKGATVDFLERDSLSYHNYDLLPLLTFAAAEKLLGRKVNSNDFYFYSSTEQNYTSTLSKAVDFLTPYNLGETTHQEFINSINIANGINHDQERYCVDPENVNNYGPTFCPWWSAVKSRSYTTYSLDSFFRSSSVNTINLIRNRTDKYPFFETMFYALANKVSEGTSISQQPSQVIESLQPPTLPITGANILTFSLNLLITSTLYIFLLKFKKYYPKNSIN